MANFTASRVSTERVRKLRFFEPRQYVSIDYARQDLLVIRVGSTSGAGEIPPEIASALASGKIDLSKIDLSRLDLSKINLSGIDQSKIDLSAINPAMLAQLAGQASGPAPGLSFSKPEVTLGEPLRLEILSFLESVRTRRTPQVTAQQGRAALAQALEIQASMEAHAHRAGLADFFAPGT